MYIEKALRNSPEGSHAIVNINVKNKALQSGELHRCVTLQRVFVIINCIIA